MLGAALLLLAAGASALVFSPWGARKAKLYGLGLMKLAQGVPPDSICSGRPSPQPGSCSCKRVMFIRHGESVWNACFNPQSTEEALFRAPASLVLALFREARVFLDGDASLLDSPLSTRGQLQAQELAHALEHSTSIDRDLRNAALSASGSACFVCSNLRRSAETLLLACSAARKSHSSVEVHTALQEASRNIDTVSLSDGGAGNESEDTAKPKLPACRRYETCLNALGTNNTGNAPLYQPASERVDAFAKWAMSRPESVIVTSGHSLWFRKLFQRLLAQPSSTSNELAQRACKSKIRNGGVVAFNLVTDTTDATIAIDPSSIQEVHLGFANVKEGEGSKKRSG
jgi:hypothetical protein